MLDRSPLSVLLGFSLSVAAVLMAASTAQAFAPWPLQADPRWLMLCAVVFGAIYGQVLARLLGLAKPPVPLSLAGALVAALLYSPGALLAGMLTDAYGPLALPWPWKPIVLAGVAGAIATATLTAWAGRGDRAPALGVAGLVSFSLGLACDRGIRDLLVPLIGEPSALIAVALHLFAIACAGLIAGCGIAATWLVLTAGEGVSQQASG